jgi:hypothetical protein
MFHSFRVIGVTSDAERGVLGPRLDECGFMVLDLRGLAFTGLGFVFGATAFAGAGLAGSPLFVLGLEGVGFVTGSRRTRTVRIGAVWTGDFRGFSVLTFVGRMMASWLCVFL